MLLIKSCRSFVLIGVSFLTSDKHLEHKSMNRPVSALRRVASKSERFLLQHVQRIIFSLSFGGLQATFGPRPSKMYVRVVWGPSSPLKTRPRPLLVRVHHRQSTSGGCRTGSCDPELPESCRCIFPVCFVVQLQHLSMRNPIHQFLLESTLISVS